LLEGHCLAAGLDLAACCFADGLGNDPGLIVFYLVVLGREQLPKARNNIAQDQVDGVIGYQLGADTPELLEEGVALLVVGAGKEEQRVSLKARFLRQGASRSLDFSCSGFFYHPGDACSDACCGTPRAVELPIMSKQRRLDGGG